MLSFLILLELQHHRQDNTNLAKIIQPKVPREYRSAAFLFVKQVIYSLKIISPKEHESKF